MGSKVARCRGGKQGFETTIVPTDRFHMDSQKEALLKSQNEPKCSLSGFDWNAGNVDVGIFSPEDLLDG